MNEPSLKANLRTMSGDTAVIDIEGDLTGAAENALMDTYTRADSAGARRLILNFAGLKYMNSTGIGLLVTLLIRVNRRRQKLLAVGLSDHYLQILELTRLSEAIQTFPTEAEALAHSG